MKRVPNIISALRIGLSLSLLFVKPLDAAFIIIYLVCGLSDALDGFIARKTHSTSKLGEKLDSAADFILFAVLLWVLFPIIHPSLLIITWVVSIAAVRVISIAAVLIRYRTLGLLHTYGNKITGFILFALPLSLAVFKPDLPVFIICTAASLSALEELAINLSSKYFSANQKSIFSKGQSEDTPKADKSVHGRT